VKLARRYNAAQSTAGSHQTGYPSKYQRNAMCSQIDPAYIETTQINSTPEQHGPGEGNKRGRSHPVPPAAAAEKAGRAWWTGGGEGADLPSVARRGVVERRAGQGREGFGE
jgi:hypothetical protein